MQKLYELRTRTINITIILNLSCFAAAFLFDPSIALGFIFGMCFGLISFNLRVKALNQMTNNQKAAGRQFLNYISRNILYAVAIFLSLQYNKINVFSTVCGLTSVNIVLMILSITSKQQTQEKSISTLGPE
ncbi:MAG: ATP synthase subunit I [Candidatus Margulisiibacteriota bacterium]